MKPRDWFWMLFALFIVFMVFIPILHRSGTAARRRRRAGRDAWSGLAGLTRRTDSAIKTPASYVLTEVLGHVV
jgi:hypothetical protein